MIPTQSKDWLNIAGGVLTIAGVWLVYRGSPLVDSAIDGGGASTDHHSNARLATKKNRLAKVGVWLVLSGSVIQVTANFIPSSP